MIDVEARSGVSNLPKSAKSADSVPSCRFVFFVVKRIWNLVDGEQVGTYDTYATIRAESQLMGEVIKFEVSSVKRGGTRIESLLQTSQFKPHTCPATNCAKQSQSNGSFKFEVSSGKWQTRRSNLPFAPRKIVQNKANLMRVLLMVTTGQERGYERR